MIAACIRKFKQSGQTVAITSPVISTVQSVQQQAQAAGNTSSGRMQALAAANVAMQAKQGAAQVQDAISKGDATGGAGISASLGSSSSQSKQASSADNARGSSVTAGGNITIQATRSAGAPNDTGKDSDITIQGSNVQAGKATTLQADDQVNLLAASNTSTESNTQSRKSGSIGVAISTQGIGVTASASRATGQGAGNGTTFTNSQVSGSTVNIESGGDTTLKGAVVRGDQVTTNVGGNLNIESLQDTNRFHEKSQSADGSAMVGLTNSGPVSGNVNLGRTSINSTFTSVNEQSAIRAGDGGFQVNVQGATTLTGGQITSTQAAVDNNKNSYQAKEGTTTTDLQNSASFEAKSVSIGLGAGAALPGQSLSAGLSGVGIGSDKGSASSTTTAGISGVAGNTAARTGDKETGIGQIFDKDKVRAEVAAQVAITGEFGKQASKAVGDYAGAKLKEAEKNKDQAGIDAWKEGGTNRVAMHAVVGGLTGGASGAVGASAASAAAPVLDQLQGQLQQGLQNAGLGEGAAKAMAGLASGATAAGIGAAASGGTAAGAATAFNADMNNRQLHPAEVQKAKDLAAKSGGKYKQSEIEEQMRLMGNAVTKEQPNTTTVLPTAVAVLKSYNDDPNMPRTAQGPVVMEVPGQANPELQAWIISNTTQGAGYISGTSPYSASNSGLNRPTTTNTPGTAPVTAACANNDLACKSGVGAQQSSIPQMTQAARQAIADGASTTSRQAGVIGAAATAATAAASPPVKPITGAVAVGATVIGVAADAVAYVANPEPSKFIKEQIGIGMPASVLVERYPLWAPIINEVAEQLKKEATK